jgi:transposase-like protein
MVSWESLNLDSFSPMPSPSLFKWRHFLPDVILLNVRWYCRYALSYRDLEEMMTERGIEVDRSTINRWVLKYSPELDLRIRPHLNQTNDSWRVDETYVKVKGQWKYLYRAVDSEGNTLDFLLRALRRCALQQNGFGVERSMLLTLRFQECLSACC